MRLLVAFDGSASSRAMLASLRYAALPERGEVCVVSVAERGLEALVEAEIGAEVLAGVLPGWAIEQRPLTGSAAAAILAVAEDWQADLIAVGAIGRGGLARFLIGSVAFKVANEAKVSVRVCRGGELRRRIVLAYDGLAGSHAAVAAVCARRWAPRTQAVVVSCYGFGGEPDLSGLEEVKEQLRGVGLEAVVVVTEDDPKRAIVEEAANGVDCIFLGDNDQGLVERMLLGTVAAAVLPRANCSVEIVRPKRKDAA